MKEIIEKLYQTNYLEEQELVDLLENMTPEYSELIKSYAHETRIKRVGASVFMRGLIEFTSYCKQNCLYCGIRAENSVASRYRLSNDEILDCCRVGHSLGYRTFVLQGGEDPYYNDERIVELVKTIRTNFPDCAITLSIGEKSYDSYKMFFDAGADRYLLRHETASKELYSKLHPNMNFENRINCLENLKKIGYQVGAGFMTGLPRQTNIDYAKDLVFLKKLNPHMVGIGPFIPQKDTPLRNEKGGTLETTLLLISIVRLLLPHSLIPATTALGSINPQGRELGIKAGANVVMPNLSPVDVRAKYALYDGKICTGDEAAECRKCIERRIIGAGFSVDMSRGDYELWEKK